MRCWALGCFFFLLPRILFSPVLASFHPEYLFIYIIYVVSMNLSLDLDINLLNILPMLNNCEFFSDNYYIGCVGQFSIGSYRIFEYRKITNIPCRSIDRSAIVFIEWVLGPEFDIFAWFSDPIDGIDDGRRISHTFFFFALIFITDYALWHLCANTSMNVCVFVFGCIIRHLFFEQFFAGRAQQTIDKLCVYKMSYE